MITDSKSIYQFTVFNNLKQEISLSKFEGKVLCIVNIASNCGHTYQVAQLENLYQKYRNNGFEILAFPSNQFAQEPRNNSEIKEFCSINYGVTFQIFDKIKVRGNHAHPLFQFLSSKKLNGKFSSPPWWNFYKYIIDRNGYVVDSFYTYTTPENSRIKNCIINTISQLKVIQAQ